jgi:hypothetical protein
MTFFEQRLQLLIVYGITSLIVFAGLFLGLWMRQQRQRLEFERERAREDSKVEIERELTKRELNAQNYDQDKSAFTTAGMGSGGYIVVEMPEKDRSLFHDLLKGFEDYAKLKGYQISFSIDASLVGRIAFKFTVQNEGVVVGPERVRRDFNEYMQNVQTGAIEDLDHIPVITSIEEHNLLVTNLKNRLTFIHHSYQLTQNALRFYENLLSNVRTFPALPTPNVIVHTGGQMDSRSYSAVNSQKVLQGDNSALTDSSINIGESFNQRQERIAVLDDVIEKLKNNENPSEPIKKAEVQLIKVRDELADEEQPDRSSIKKWLETAKNLLASTALTFEVSEGVKKLFELFGS